VPAFVLTDYKSQSLIIQVDLSGKLRLEKVEKVDLKYLRQDINWWMWAAAVQPWISSNLEQIEFTPDWYKKRHYSADIRMECCLENYILLHRSLYQKRNI
jgi:hypothetical protein